MTGGQEFTFTACEWAVVNGEGHFDGWFRDFYEWQWFHCFWAADGFTDGYIFQTGDANDVAHFAFLSRNTNQAFDLIQGNDLAFVHRIRVVMFADNDWIVDFYDTASDLTDSDTANVFVVVDGRNKILEWAIDIAFRCRNFGEDGIEQRVQVFTANTRFEGSSTFFTGAVQNFGFQLFFSCIQIEEQVVNFFTNFFVSCVRTVGFIYNDDNFMAQLQRFLQNETGLWHWTLEGVYQQDNTVYHFQNTLNFAAEVSMAWGIDNVDFYIFISDCSIFCKNGDAAFFFQVTGVHNTVLYGLVFAESTALFQHLVNQGGFTVVNVGDDRNISQVFSNQSDSLLLCQRIYELHSFRSLIILRLFPVFQCLCAIPLYCIKVFF